MKAIVSRNVMHGSSMSLSYRLHEPLFRLFLCKLDPGIPRTPSKRQHDTQRVRRCDGEVEHEHRAHDRQHLLHIRCHCPRVRKTRGMRIDEKKRTCDSHPQRAHPPVGAEAHDVQAECDAAIHEERCGLEQRHIVDCELVHFIELAGEVCEEDALDEGEWGEEEEEVERVCKVWA